MCDGPEGVFFTQGEVITPMTKADQVRAILATEPDLTHEQIAIQVGCSRRWVSAIARAMRPPPAETDIEARLRALEQWRKDITEHLKRRENRSNAALNYRPSPRLSLKFGPDHGKTSSNPSFKASLPGVFLSSSPIGPK